VIFTLTWPLLLSLAFLVVTDILSLVSMEFVALQVCAELIMLVICSVDPSYVPTIDPCIARAKRPPLHLEHFLRWINNRIDRLVDDLLAPWITVKRRHTALKQRSARSYDTKQKCCFCWRLICTESVSWWRNYLFSKWNCSSWSERSNTGRHRKHCPRWST
jgi:hypothetical protein